MSGNATRAIEQFEAALALDPSMAIAYNNIGFAHGRAGDYKAARRAFSSVGSRAQALLNISIVFEENGELALASGARTKALALDPSLKKQEVEQ